MKTKLRHCCQYIRTLYMSLEWSPQGGNETVMKISSLSQEHQNMFKSGIHTDVQENFLSFTATCPKSLVTDISMRNIRHQVTDLRIIKHKLYLQMWQRSHQNCLGKLEEGSQTALCLTKLRRKEREILISNSSVLRQNNKD